MIVGPPDTFYEEGFFKAKLQFPADFPNMPPKMTFVSEIVHPNVYESGEVCISILHPPGEDAMNPQELAIERWRPILGVEAIIVSAYIMLMELCHGNHIEGSYRPVFFYHILQYTILISN